MLPLAITALEATPGPTAPEGSKVWEEVPRQAEEIGHRPVEGIVATLRDRNSNRVSNAPHAVSLVHSELTHIST